jgi:hypothetical protein
MTKISASLFVESEDWSVEEMSSRIGLQPTGGWRKGELRGATGKLHTTSAWQFTENATADDEADQVASALESALRSLVEKITGYEERFCAVAESHTAGCLIAISSKFVPPLIISSPLLTAISKLNVDLEIDVILQ